MVFLQTGVKYSRNALGRDGQTLCDPHADVFAHEEALLRVNDWRMLHIRPLQDFNAKLQELFALHHIESVFSSQRIKRMASILGKLKVNPQMRLGGLQDIGGIRFVFSSVQQVLDAAQVIQMASFDGFHLTKVNDYISHPKCSGYRSIHFVFKYHSGEPDNDGLLVELQIRTLLQHSWAMAVETAGVIVQTSLKANTDDHPEWRLFFKLTSAILARVEMCNVSEAFANHDNQMLLADYSCMNANHRFLDKLKALRVSASSDSIVNEDNGLCVLHIDYSSKQLSFRVFPKNQEQQATELFTALEGKIDNSRAAVLLASVAKMIELPHAYPSFFLDTQEFISAIEAFENNF